MATEYPDPADRLTPEHRDFLEDVRRAMVDRRQTVVISGFSFRFLRKGDRTADELADEAVSPVPGLARVASVPGVYIRMEVAREGPQGSAGHWWRRLGFSDEIDSLLARYVLHLDHATMEVIRLRISAAHTLERMAMELHQGRLKAKSAP